MPRSSYQYETSPRKYEPEYEPKPKKQTAKYEKTVSKNKYQSQKEKKKAERAKHTAQIVVILVVFGMLLAVSYREIAIMEMFNSKQELESQLSLIEKENGQIEKDIKAEESKIDLNEIKQRAIEELGMQETTKISVELDKTDNVETDVVLIEEDTTSFIERLIEKFIINFQ